MTAFIASLYTIFFQWCSKNRAELYYVPKTAVMNFSSHNSVSSFSLNF